MTSKAARRLPAKFNWVKKKKKEIFQKAVCLSQLMEVISVYLCNVIVDLESLTAGSKTVMCHVSAVIGLCFKQLLFMETGNTTSP